jgi:oligosaccharyltransferase complex subunit epsilon
MRTHSRSSVPDDDSARASLLSGGVVRDVWNAYTKHIPPSLRAVDALLAYILWAGAVQFAYAIAVGTFPFNSFLAGFLSCVSAFVLTVSLRMQINPENSSASAHGGCPEWAAVTPHRAYADWLFCNLVVHIAVLNFMG